MRFTNWLTMDYKDIYFIGIGGIGMSAIARYYNFKGYKVSGYDRTPSALTAELEAEGIAVHYEDNIDCVPKCADTTLVIWTPAIPHDMKELSYVRENGYKVVKRSEMLGEIARGQDCLAVAGSHGKTTTSTLLAHILQTSGAGCSAFLGGISKNYNTNLLLGHNPVIVAEADEFDRSFLQLHPKIAAITAIDPDHLDIYSDLEHVREAFRLFASQVTDTVIAKYGVGIEPSETYARVMSYALDDERADFYASDISCDECGYFTFNIHYRIPGGNGRGVLCDCRCGVPGRVNVENSVAAAAIALTYGIEAGTIRKALASFSGVKRRFDIHLNTPTCSYIDDYAHHPAEIAAAISSMRNIFPLRRITVVFQPHLYTRTRDFADEFAASLSLADKLVLLDIYPAREEPIPGVTSEIIFRNVTTVEKVLLNKNELMDYLKDEPVDILATLGAGDIDRFIDPITRLLEKRTGQ